MKGVVAFISKLLFNTNEIKSNEQIDILLPGRGRSVLANLEIIGQRVQYYIVQYSLATGKNN